MHTFDHILWLLMVLVGTIILQAPVIHALSQVAVMLNTL